MFQKYISRISSGSLEGLLIGINKIAIREGLEDIKQIRIDSTVVKTNIHYPTNNSLVWDCIKESHRLLSKLADQTDGLASFLCTASFGESTLSVFLKRSLPLVGISDGLTIIL